MHVARRLSATVQMELEWALFLEAPREDEYSINILIGSYCLTTTLCAESIFARYYKTGGILSIVEM